MGILLLLGLWSIAPLTGLLHPHPRNPADHIHSEVETHRIEVAAQSAAVCHHHPEGCPTDCHCPKFVPEAAGQEVTVPASGTLSEPSLVQCTEGQSKHNHLPALVAFWPPGTLVPLEGMATGSVWPAGSASPLDPHRDPPRHVPRSAASHA